MIFELSFQSYVLVGVIGKKGDVYWNIVSVFDLFKKKSSIQNPEDFFSECKSLTTIAQEEYLEDYPLVNFRMKVIPHARFMYLLKDTQHEDLFKNLLSEDFFVTIINNRHGLYYLTVCNEDTPNAKQYSNWINNLKIKMQKLEMKTSSSSYVIRHSWKIVQFSRKEPYNLEQTGISRQNCQNSPSLETVTSTPLSPPTSTDTTPNSLMSPLSAPSTSETILETFRYSPLSPPYVLPSSSRSTPRPFSYTPSSPLSSSQERRIPLRSVASTTHGPAIFKNSISTPHTSTETTRPTIFRYSWMTPPCAPSISETTPFSYSPLSPPCIFPSSTPMSPALPPRPPAPPRIPLRSPASTTHGFRNITPTFPPRPLSPSPRIPFRSPASSTHDPLRIPTCVVHPHSWQTLLPEQLPEFLPASIDRAIPHHSNSSIPSLSPRPPSSAHTRSGTPTVEWSEYSPRESPNPLHPQNEPLNLTRHGIHIWLDRLPANIIYLMYDNNSQIFIPRDR